ncbi:MAG: hypothetical protein U5J64_07810 [Halobacteriales archaeon]|nr:hypothetical protein [Halobacteriales archaeon]
MHELGHVLGAQHPASDTNLPNADLGTHGVMCKYSCFDTLYSPGDAILFNEGFSQVNHDRILNNDEDWYDGWVTDRGNMEPKTLQKPEHSFESINGGILETGEMTG